MMMVNIIQFTYASSFVAQGNFVIYNTFYAHTQTELGSDEESGKDWSDLEREAAEDDANYSTKQEDTFVGKKKPSGHDRRDKHKSSKNHR